MSNLGQILNTLTSVSSASSEPPGEYRDYILNRPDVGEPRIV
jgi:hypothetical protein